MLSLPSVELESTTATMDGLGMQRRNACATSRHRAPPLRTGIMIRVSEKAGACIAMAWIVQSPLGINP
jgi:hypothetical protein